MQYRVINPDIDYSRVLRYKDEGLLIESVHPSLPLAIYNYTVKCTYEKIWDDVTLSCRGLVFDTSTGKIVARPFPKFFNIEELPDFEEPNFNPSITLKEDGSLGILFLYGAHLIFCSRGSFISPQSQIFREIWLERYLTTEKVESGITYLFEIIYPENRIVVNYGEYKGLKFITALDTVTGREVSLDYSSSYETVKIINNPNWKYIRDLYTDQDNMEGFVVNWDGLRVKMKLEKYILLHRAISGLSEQVIWETMKLSTFADKDSDETLLSLLKLLPDEAYKWAIGIVKKINDRIEYVNTQVLIEYEECMKLETRKDQALYLANKDPFVKSAVFNKLSSKDYREIIWKSAKPESSNQFLRKGVIEEMEGLGE